MASARLSRRKPPGVVPRLAHVGARGEVVDDVRPRVGDRRARRRRVEQVDARRPARRRTTSSPAARHAAVRWRPAKPEAPVIRALTGRWRPGAPASRARWRRPPRRRPARAPSPAGSAAARARRARRRTAGAARSPARTRAGCPTAAGTAEVERSITAVSGHVAEVLGEPDRGAAQRRRARQARGDVGVQRRRTRAPLTRCMREAARAGRRRPAGARAVRAARRRRSRRRRPACRAAAGRPTPPRRRRRPARRAGSCVRSKAIAATVTTATRSGTPGEERPPR